MIPLESGKPVPAVDNAIKILRHLAAQGTPVGVAPIARATGISVSTTFNILKTLVRQGFVSFETQSKTYRIGMGVLEIVAPVLGANPNDLIRPLIEGIVAEFGIMIALLQLSESGRMILIDTMQPLNIVHATLNKGARMPAMLGALGRCYTGAIGMDRATCETRFAELRWQNAPAFDTYWDEAEQARKDGYAFDFGNLFVGLNNVASLACDSSGMPRIGLSAMAIVGQLTRAQMDEVALALRDTARLIETNIFGRSSLR